MRWVRRVKGALGMGITWAIGWAMAGIGMGAASLVLPWLPWDRFFDVFDAPLPAMAIPGFVGGMLFSVVVGVAGRQRRFDELSMPRFAAWGALGGALLALVPSAMVLAGVATPADGARDFLAATAVIAPVFVALGAGSAAATLWLARRAARGNGTPPPARGPDTRALGDGAPDAWHGVRPREEVVR
jgi:hypothetical protein